ncbi:exodeoxyribonuclease VII large subunit [Halalkalibacter akibai JCM 9157]|uniref:Exodeoxyribonuclease 7 large subunit n=2 Tax=Halalkalibacter akibai TaxID=1411 RepID=W4QW33_HALA3|nr:exodeoxyribonuclease VII large subunit [Halalkalibacter akibai JCM 9157]
MHTRGHLYFTVKDQQSRMQAVMFAGNNRFLKFKPENGMKVIIRGEVNVYEPYGQYQFYAKEMQPDGIGSLYLAYEKLKAQLEKEGLFDEARKKPIPAFPERIAVITSPTGAAIRDIVTTLKRRYPVTQITLLPVLVQGEQAPASIIRAVEQADLANCFDCLIIGRGGGSIEELWAFNDEGVVRAIAATNMPVISAVGHETDFTISDFVADLRAPTPTGAAELAVPDIREINRSLLSMQNRMKKLIENKLSVERSKLERLKRSYAFRYPEQLIQQKEQQLDGNIDRLKRSLIKAIQEPATNLVHLDKALNRLHPELKIEQAKENKQHLHEALVKAMKEHLKLKRQPFEKVIGELNLLSPLRLMDRGYSLAYKQEDHSLVKTLKQVNVGEKLDIRLKDGLIHCLVEETKSMVEEEKNDD